MARYMAQNKCCIIIIIIITHDNSLALVLYLCWFIFTPDISYVGALPLIILNMWPSINYSTLYSIGSSPTCLNSLAPTWNLHGAFNINLIILFWVHCILHFNFFDNPYTKLSRCNQNGIDSKQISTDFLF